MNVWPLSSHYRALFYLNFSSTLTFRIICLKKREGGVKRKHIEFSACFTQILMNYSYVFSGTMLTEIFLVEFSEDSICSFISKLKKMWIVHCLKSSHRRVMSEAILECWSLYSYIGWNILYTLKQQEINRILLPQFNFFVLHFHIDTSFENK